MAILDSQKEHLHRDFKEWKDVLEPDTTPKPDEPPGGLNPAGPVLTMEGQMQARVYDIQVHQYMRQMFKPGNNNFHGIPLHLRSVEYPKWSDVRELAQRVLSKETQNYIDSQLYKDDKVKLDRYEKMAKKVTKQGGPLLGSDLDGYPGPELYMEHLRQNFGLTLEEITSIQTPEGLFLQLKKKAGSELDDPDSLKVSRDVSKKLQKLKTA